MRKVIVVILSAAFIAGMLLFVSGLTARADWKENSGMQDKIISYCFGDPAVMDDGEILTATIRCCQPQEDTMCNLSKQNDLCPE